MVDKNSVQQLSLHIGATADELWQQWLDMRVLVEQAGDRMNDTAQLWKQAGAPAKDRLWAEYEAAAREYRVLASWKDVFYAAFIFATDGADCAAFTRSSPS